MIRIKIVKIMRDQSRIMRYSIRFWNVKNVSKNQYYDFLRLNNDTSQLFDLLSQNVLFIIMRNNMVNSNLLYQYYEY